MDMKSQNWGNGGRSPWLARKCLRSHQPSWIQICLKSMKGPSGERDGPGKSSLALLGREASGGCWYILPVHTVSEESRALSDRDMSGGPWWTPFEGDGPEIHFLRPPRMGRNWETGTPPREMGPWSHGKKACEKPELHSCLGFPVSWDGKESAL